MVRKNHFYLPALTGRQRKRVETAVPIHFLT
jgi:hypothetical protein